MQVSKTECRDTYYIYFQSITGLPGAMVARLASTAECFPYMGTKRLQVRVLRWSLKFCLLIFVHKWTVDYVDQCLFLRALWSIIVHLVHRLPISSFPETRLSSTVARELSSYFPAPIVHFYSVYVACNRQRLPWT